MSLAYLFWHRPAPGVDPAAYEGRLRAFHAALELPGSRTVRLASAPWLAGEGPVYEDWYPVEGWEALGALNERAVSGPRRTPHDAAAEHAGTGAGGVYRRVSGPGSDPAGAAQWLAKPPGRAYADWLPELVATAGDRAAVWQRQMVLGPAPEFCVLSPAPADLPWPATATEPEPL